MGLGVGAVGLRPPVPRYGKAPTFPGRRPCAVDSCQGWGQLPAQRPNLSCPPPGEVNTPKRRKPTTRGSLPSRRPGEARSQCGEGAPTRPNTADHPEGLLRRTVIARREVDGMAGRPAHKPQANCTTPAIPETCPSGEEARPAGPPQPNRTAAEHPTSGSNSQVVPSPPSYPQAGHNAPRLSVPPDRLATGPPPGAVGGAHPTTRRAVDLPVREPRAPSPPLFPLVSSAAMAGGVCAATAARTRHSHRTQATDQSVTGKNGKTCHRDTGRTRKGNQ